MGSLTGWCRQDEFILFFLPTFALCGQIGNGNSNPTHITAHLQAHTSQRSNQRLAKELQFC